MNNVPQKPKRIWQIVLVGSLVVNFILIGFGVGIASNIRRAPDGPPPAVFGSVYLRALSRESRRELGQEMREVRKGHAEKHGRNSLNNYGYDQAIAILTTTPLDGQALRDVMVEQEQVSSEHLSQARDLLLSHLLRMSQEDRHEYAEEIKKILHRRDH